MPFTSATLGANAAQQEHGCLAGCGSLAGACSPALKFRVDSLIEPVSASLVLFPMPRTHGRASSATSLLNSHCQRTPHRSHSIRPLARQKHIPVTRLASTSRKPGRLAHAGPPLWPRARRGFHVDRQTQGMLLRVQAPLDVQRRRLEQTGHVNVCGGGKRTTLWSNAAAPEPKTLLRHRHFFHCNRARRTETTRAIEGKI